MLLAVALRSLLALLHAEASETGAHARAASPHAICLVTATDHRRLLTPMYLNQVIVTREEARAEFIRFNLNGLILFWVDLRRPVDQMSPRTAHASRRTLRFMALCGTPNLPTTASHAGIPSEEPESIVGAATFGRASAAEQEQVLSNALAQGGQSNRSRYDGC